MQSAKQAESAIPITSSVIRLITLPLSIRRGDPRRRREADLRRLQVADEVPQVVLGGAVAPRPRRTPQTLRGLRIQVSPGQGITRVEESHNLASLSTSHCYSISSLLVRQNLLFP